MQVSKADIIARLRRELLPLEGNSGNSGAAADAVIKAIPGVDLPTGCLHEFLVEDEKQKAPTYAFIAGLASGLYKNGAVGVWISHQLKVFPPALVQFGINPSQLIFLQVPSLHDIDWVAEEVLSCEGLASVIVENKNLDFTQSRRFQLAMEKSRVTCFYIRPLPARMNITASISRWKIQSAPSGSIDELPGIGHPRFRASLLKLRNRQPRIWDIEWRDQSLELLTPEKEIPLLSQKKTG